MRGPVWLWIAIGGIGLALAIGWLMQRCPAALEDDDALRRLAFFALLATLFAGGAIAAIRRNPLKGLGQLAFWAALVLLLVLGYSLKDDAGAVWARLTGALLPGQAIATDGGALEFRRDKSGHFPIEAQVNGRLIRFVLDTGATRVSLTPADARALGFDPADLEFVLPVETANGSTFAAPIELDLIEIGSIRVERLSALVMAADGDQSLLGMNFLNRLSGFSVEGDRLILKP